MRLISTRTPRIGNRNDKNQASIRRQPKIGSATSRIQASKPFPWRPILRIVFASIVVAFIVWLMNSPIFLVRAYNITGLKNVPEDAVAQQMPKKSNLWLFPANKVRDRVKTASPLIADVAIYRKVPNTIQVVVAERVLALQWQSADKSYIVGLDGDIIAQMDPKQVLPKVVDTTNIVPAVGKQVVSPGFVQFIQQLQAQFQTIIGVPLDHMEIGETTFDVTAVPKTGPKIILDSTRDPAVQLKAGKPVLEQFGDKIKQYLDLRVPEKGYFQ